MSPTLPTVTLDRTLFDLYSLDGGNGRDVGLVMAVPPPGPQVAPSFPRPVKYAYQSPRYPKLGNEIFARICLGSAAQYHAFQAGPMPLYLFDVEPPKSSSFFSKLTAVPGHREDAERVYSQLSETQRPDVRFLSAPSDIKRAGNTKLISYTPLDILDRRSLTVNPEVHYKLLSKRTLAFAPLTSPKTEIIDAGLSCKQVDTPSLVSTEVARMIKPIEQRALPFVVKVPQAVGGQGVFVLKDEADRADCLEILREETTSMVKSINASNEHLKPACLILQEMLPGVPRGLNLFVTKTGRSIWISCTEPILDERNYWSGAFVDFNRQRHWEQVYGETAKQISQYVYEQGYYGPLGADIMLDENEKQHVIDLNVRLTGSYILGLMKTHFTTRGMNCASLLTPLAVKGDRNAFEEKFSKELEEGRLVIIGWTHGRGGPGNIFRYSLGSLVVGGEDQASMLAMMDTINAIRIRK
ncbi:hypothetical protein VP1G_08281 [Cytospora mali]|uniref:ATP-grasp domain-containing protein n=1 Tax=Cytospora mali TaxID=578113 RepID=A0A194VB47_CYTMA|nr:hypothetical protein VP1G_08281 [Valsa mali var. pyri (nom. inval.)]